MQEQSGAVKHRGGPGFLRYIPVKIILTIAILAAVFGAGVGVRSVLVSGNKLTRLGFEDIGELATQAAYCTEVNVTEGARELLAYEFACRAPGGGPLTIYASAADGRQIKIETGRS